MLAALVGTVVAAGLLLRGGWDLWAQSTVILILLTGAAAWLCARLASGWLPRPDSRMLAWVASLLALSALSAFLSPVPVYARPAWAATAAGLALIPFGSMLDAEGRERVLAFLRAAGWILVLLALYQRFHGATRPAATFINQNVFAGVILLLLPVAVRAKDWPLAVVLMACLWWTRSIGAWVGLSVALILHRRAVGTAAFWLGCAIGFVGLVVVYAKLQSPETLHRLAWWRAAWHMSAGSPWLGLGPGAFVYALPAYGVERLELSTLFAHQHFLEVVAERGRPYALLWITGLFAILKPAQGPRRFGPVAALVHGLVDYPLSVPGVFWLFCASTALAAPESNRSVNIPLRWRPVLCSAVIIAAIVSGAALRNGWTVDHRVLLNAAPESHVR